MRSPRAIAITLALTHLYGCGAKTGLDVPPPAPCELDASVERVPLLCSSFELGSPIALTDEPGPVAFDAPFLDVDSLDVVTTPEGAWIVYQYVDDRIDAVEMRTLSIDPEGRALGEAQAFVSRRNLYARSLVEPSAVVWGCGRAALGGLMSTRRDGSDLVSGCALAIETQTSSRVVTVDADENCTDLQLDGDGLSWLHLQLTGSALGIHLERADLDGGSRSTEVSGGPMLYRRIPLADGTFLAAHHTGPSDVPRADVWHVSSAGAFLEETRLTNRFLRQFASAVDEEGVPWIIWSESDARDDEVENLFASRTREDGILSPPVPLDASGLRFPFDETRPVWLGHRLVVPLIDEERALSLVVLDEEGAQVSVLPVTDDARRADLVLVRGGAVLVYADTRFEIDDRGLRIDRGSVLTARALRCAL